jgi:hypothetical protein
MCFHVPLIRASPRFIMKVFHFYSNFGFPYFGTFRFHVVSKLLVLLMLRRSVFTYIYYLLIKKDLRECRNL